MNRIPQLASFTFESLEPRTFLSMSSVFESLPDVDPAAGALRDTFMEHVAALEAKNGLAEPGRYCIDIVTPERPLVSRSGTVGGVLGTFVGKTTASAYSAEVFWGDGVQTDAMIVANADGIFAIEASHEYADNDVHVIAVHVNASDGSEGIICWPQLYAITHADPLVMTFPPIVYSDYNVEAYADYRPDHDPQLDQEVVAMFVDVDHVGGDGSGYVASVDWGDGTQSSAEVRPSYDGGYYLLSERHSYGAIGEYDVTFTVSRTDANAPASLTGVGAALVYPHGTFAFNTPDGSYYWVTQGDITTAVKGPVHADRDDGLIDYDDGQSTPDDGNAEAPAPPSNDGEPEWFTRRAESNGSIDEPSQQEDGQSSTLDRESDPLHDRPGDVSVIDLAGRD